MEYHTVYIIVYHCLCINLFFARTSTVSLLWKMPVTDHALRKQWQKNNELTELFAAGIIYTFILNSTWNWQPLEPKALCLSCNHQASEAYIRVSYRGVGHWVSPPEIWKLWCHNCLNSYNRELNYRLDVLQLNLMLLVLEDAQNFIKM